MDKVRTRTVLGDVVCTNSDGDAWHWGIQVGSARMHFVWIPTVGLNCFRQLADGEREPIGEFPNLTIAVAFCLGWTEGIAEAARLTRAELSALNIVSPTNGGPHP